MTILSVGKSQATVKAGQNELYQDAARCYGPALARLARAYEADPEKRRDLLQEIHLNIWCSLGHFDARCSLRTWVYRVAHNIASSHVIRELRTYARLVSLEELDALPPEKEDEAVAGRPLAWERIGKLIQQLKPVERQVILLYLEGLDAASIGEITGLSPANVGMKIHRIKSTLSRRFNTGGDHAE